MFLCVCFRLVCGLFLGLGDWLFSTVFCVCFRAGHVFCRGERCSSVFGCFFSERFLSGFVLGRFWRRGYCLQCPVCGHFLSGGVPVPAFSVIFPWFRFSDIYFSIRVCLFVWQLSCGNHCVFSWSQLSCTGQRRLDRLCGRQHY